MTTQKFHAKYHAAEVRQLILQATTDLRGALNASNGMQGTLPRSPANLDDVQDAIAGAAACLAAGRTAVERYEYADTKIRMDGPINRARRLHQEAQEAREKVRCARERIQHRADMQPGRAS